MLLTDALSVWEAVHLSGPMPAIDRKCLDVILDSGLSPTYLSFDPSKGLTMEWEFHDADYDAEEDFYYRFMFFLSPSDVTLKVGSSVGWAYLGIDNVSFLQDNISLALPPPDTPSNLRRRHWSILSKYRSFVERK